MAATMNIAVSDALNAIAPRTPQIAFHGRELDRQRPVCCRGSRKHQPGGGTPVRSGTLGGLPPDKHRFCRASCRGVDGRSA